MQLITRHFPLMKKLATVFKSQVEVINFVKLKRTKNLFIMTSNGIKVSLESYFKLDIDRLLSPESSLMEESHLKFKNDIFEFDKPEEYFTKQMEAKRLLLIEFTERTADIYSTKFGELLHKQEAEMDALKRDFLQDLKSEMEKWQNYLNFVRQEEKKLIKQLIYLRKVYNDPEVKNRGFKRVAEIHNTFFQKYEDLIVKHKSEVKSMGEIINEEVGRIKRNFPGEFRKKKSELRQNSFTNFCPDDNLSE